MDTTRIQKLADDGDMRARQMLSKANARANVPYEPGTSLEVPTKDLSNFLFRRLRSEGYRRPAIRVHFALECPRKSNAVFTTCRGVCYEARPSDESWRGIYLGPWGGGMFDVRPEKLEPLPIPKGTVFVHGERGGKGVFLSITMRPDDAVKWVKREGTTDITLDAAESQALSLLTCTKASYRARYWEHGDWTPEHPALQSLIRKGLAKRHGKGVCATGAGKAYCRNNNLNHY